MNDAAKEMLELADGFTWRSTDLDYDIDDQAFFARAAYVLRSAASAPSQAMRDNELQILLECRDFVAAVEAEGLLGERERFNARELISEADAILSAAESAAPSREEIPAVVQHMGRGKPAVFKDDEPSQAIVAGGVREATCYLERSAVRSIFMCQLDEHLHITELVLMEIDALPIFTATDIAEALKK